MAKRKLMNLRVTPIVLAPREAQLIDDMVLLEESRSDGFQPQAFDVCAQGCPG